MVLQQARRLLKMSVSQPRAGNEWVEQIEWPQTTMFIIYHSDAVDVILRVFASSW